MEKEFTSIKKYISDERFGKAEMICKRSIKKYPNQNEFNYLMAIIFHSQKKFNLSLKYINKFLKVEPNQKDALLTKVYNEMALKDNNSALKTLFFLAKIYRYNQDLNTLIAKNYEIQGDLFKAEHYYKLNIKLLPGKESLLELHNFYKKHHQYTKTLNLLENNKIVEQNSEINHEISKIYFILRNFENSLKYLLRAKRLDEDNPIILKDIGFLYSVLGNEDKSLIFYKKSIEKKSDYGFVHFQLSRIVPKINEKKLQELIFTHQNKKIKDENYIFLGLAISTYLDNKKQFQKSLFYLKKSNTIIRHDFINNENWNFENETKIFENVKTFFDLCETNYSFNTKIPIFILGLPRSGTTLIEQIISSHTDVYSLGEIPYLQTALFENIGNFNKIETHNTNKEIISFSKVHKIQKDYFKEISINSDFFTDKTPINYMYIGFISKIFPNAKIILCNRNKFDNLLSMYQTIFSDKNYKFSYKFSDLLKYHKLYVDLIKFWKNRKINFYEMIYEDLIINPKTNIKKLINYLGIKEQDDCFSFFKNKRPVLTASFNQVRKPIYQTSVQKWKNYEEFF